MAGTDIHCFMGELQYLYYNNKLKESKTKKIAYLTHAILINSIGRDSQTSFEQLLDLISQQWREGQYAKKLETQQSVRDEISSKYQPDYTLVF